MTLPRFNWITCVLSITSSSCLRLLSLILLCVTQNFNEIEWFTGKASNPSSCGNVWRNNHMHIIKTMNPQPGIPFRSVPDQNWIEFSTANQSTDLNIHHLPFFSPCSRLYQLIPSPHPVPGPLTLQSVRSSHSSFYDSLSSSRHSFTIPRN